VEEIVIPAVSPEAAKAANQIGKVLANAAADIRYIVATQLEGNGNGRK
jgi:hypothetical protein